MSTETRIPPHPESLPASVSGFSGYRWLMVVVAAVAMVAMAGAGMIMAAAAGGLRCGFTMARMFGLGHRIFSLLKNIPYGGI